MTNVLPAFDASCSTSASLVPLDFSLLQYPDAAASSSLLFSPLWAAAATTTLCSPLVADPFVKSPLLPALSISPLSSPASTLTYLDTRLPQRNDAYHSVCTTDSPMTDEALSHVSAHASPPLSDPQPPKIRKATSPIDKAAERRRKNRESSSRCYYNRKRIIQKLESQLVAEKDKLTKLYDHALQLRHDNARLKKEVVTSGYALPPSRSKHINTHSFSLREYLRLLHSSTYQNPSHALL
eukprot:TRINITY_DN64937_c0_g1_i1.p1 TRINITY_DN64937_c0_g1~~TRINITY_DN64937_c0_g1_i1.p1  ORF type:complete len:239 (+),score=46.52 TRINITY_DN64937_c0_g1_i1:72-788(+)